jgi:DNA polymerase epsilon subunit 1
MDFALNIESGGLKPEDVSNYEEVKQEIIEKLESIRGKCPSLNSEPLIYHVDVAAMYPNIILSNRLQPTAIVNEKICAGCTFNKEENDCKRNLQWQWKGEIKAIKRLEVQQVKDRLNHDLKNQVQVLDPR